MIIGLGHRRGVGKNTTANLMKKRLQDQGYTVDIRSFATPLKDIAHRLYSWGGLKNESYYEQHYEEKEIVLPLLGKSPRTIWIELGNKLRDVHPETWIKAAMHEFTDVTIFTDARYPNEMNEILNRKGMVYKVFNLNTVQYNDVADSAALDFIGWTGQINNSGTLSELEEELDAFMPKIFGELYESV